MGNDTIQTQPTVPSTGPVQTGVKTAPAPAREAAPEKARQPVSWLMLFFQGLASLRLTVVLFVLSFVLVFYGTVAQMDNGVWTVVDQYFRSFIVFIPLRLNFLVLNKFLGIPLFNVPGSIPFPAGYMLGFLLLTNLLAAHALRFRLTWARGGIILLHLGLILMLLGELATGLVSKEGDMVIPNGGNANYVSDIRNTEFAVVDTSNPKMDDVVVVPGSILAHTPSDKLITNENLPFDIHVDQWMVNSALLKRADPQTNQATAGTGQFKQVLNRPEVNGTDTDQKADYPSTYVTLLEKETGRSLGTYLASPHIDPAMDPDYAPQTVEVGGKKYEIALRFTRTYKPYRVHLIKFVHKVFPGAPDKAREFSSRIELEYPLGSPKREIVISMNNPLRLIVDWSGIVPRVDTFFQSSFLQGDNGTILHVVDNRSWLMPYISCSLVAIGLLWHFLVLLPAGLRRAFLKAGSGRVGSAGADLNAQAQVARPLPPSWRWAPVVGIGLPLFCILYSAIPASNPANGLHLQEAGRLPVQFAGRIQPLDTMARNLLMSFNTRESYYEEKVEPGAAPLNEEDKVWVNRPAIQWLLEVLSAHYQVEADPLFKVDEDVAARLGLLPKPGKYSYNDLKPVLGHLDDEASKIEELKPEQMSPTDKGILRLNNMLMGFARYKNITPFRVFRIENEEVQQLLGLKRREGMRYGIAEFANRLPELADQADLAERARQADPNQLTAYQSQVLRVFEMLGQYQSLVQRDERHSPRLMPPFSDPSAEHWSVWNTDGPVQTGVSEKRAAADLTRMLHSYYLATKGPANGQAAAITAFNESVADYQKLLDTAALPGTSALSLEQRYTSMAPFYLSVWFYILAALLSLAGLVFLFAGETLQPVGRGLMRVAFWMAFTTLCLHTVALIVRMYLQGRPPVTNLYSSAIFIGWGCVGLGLILDVIYRTGLGTLAGCTLGAVTGVVAVVLASAGDTMEMMQAVLDTNLWLATHVVCVTLGYTTTMLAGFLGITTIILWLVETLNGSAMQPESRLIFKDSRRILASMTYGIVCFAMLLSFVGTVLGGIWADQSWGRFWGWDPKENGAILIVIWNALILHARWGGMVKSLGVAALTVAGNMVVVWSWFGTNQLGVGLHAYGFSKTLAMFCVVMWGVHLAVLGLLLVPSLLRLYGILPPAATKTA